MSPGLEGIPASSWGFEWEVSLLRICTFFSFHTLFDVHRSPKTKVQS